ncbi:PilZ domain-containing protein [Aeoliella sp. ICT_H6.2]|uniref:PilZ domain-containing protein n=1 Tax=Aeoliella straminimaris TaxID=2954799 RepID=A0A9X2JI27_9BACT|nr:PilZ domain-containing protein [Aeoliella straminimaris]MCO6043514.1 PilZ domain-containing protein [Aeoliella straminimaris]
MLDISSQEQLNVPNWGSLPDKVQLPQRLVDFLEKEGPMPVKPDSRRGYHRMYLRSRAVMLYHDRFYAVYLSDVSRTGAGFYTPVQVLPASSVQLWMEDGQCFRVRARNCTRMGDRCYRCGGVFSRDT